MRAARRAVCSVVYLFRSVHPNLEAITWSYMYMRVSYPVAGFYTTKPRQRESLCETPSCTRVNESRKSMNVWRSDLVNIVTIITHVSTLGKHSTSSRPGQRTPIITLFLIIIVLHVVAVFKIVSVVTAAYSGVLYVTCDILSQGTCLDIVRSPNCTSVGVVVLLARHAIDRGSNPTVDDTVVKKIVDASWKVGATRVTFVRPFQTLNTNTRNTLYIFSWIRKIWKSSCFKTYIV